MVSDVLHDALVEIDRYQREMPDAYDPLTTEIETIKAVMDALRTCLDTPPGVVEEQDRLVAELQGAIRSLDLSRLLKAGQQLACWAGHHEWVVFSTALQDGSLMVQCVKCGEMGTVHDHSKEEWGKAFHAPSHPYLWTNDSRVHRQGKAPLHVIRSNGVGTRCTCPPRGDDHERRAYERFPAEIMQSDGPLSDDERHDLIHLASLVTEHKWCSAIFPTILRSFEEDGGLWITDAAKQIAERIERIDGMGLHCSPFVVARVLEEYAKESSQIREKASEKGAKT